MISAAPLEPFSWLGCCWGGMMNHDRFSPSQLYRFPSWLLVVRTVVFLSLFLKEALIEPIESSNVLIPFQRLPGSSLLVEWMR